MVCAETLASVKENVWGVDSYYFLHLYVSTSGRLGRSTQLTIPEVIQGAPLLLTIAFGRHPQVSLCYLPEPELFWARSAFWIEPVLFGFEELRVFMHFCGPISSHLLRAPLDVVTRGPCLLQNYDDSYFWNKLSTLFPGFPSKKNLFRTILVWKHQQASSAPPGLKALPCRVSDSFGLKAE